MAEPAPVVSLLTDYGLSDGFVGALHSVIRARVPGVPIVDLTHGIAPQDVRAGSWALRRAAAYLAPGVVVAVVDPGVGTSRRGVAVRAACRGGGPGLTFVGPDNGLLVPALEALGGAEACVELEDRGYWLAAPGPTFAGRDVFAPAAACLVSGAALEDLGRRVSPASLARLPGPLLRSLDSGDLEAEVTWVDRFGNVQLSATHEHLPEAAFVEVLLPSTPGATSRARVVRAFADLGPKELGILVDSYGHLALCLNAASAARLLGLGEGEVVVLRAEPNGPTGLH